ncbi:MAG: hypothetical protein U0325_25905 [Polyangiales bacterium]
MNTLLRTLVLGAALLLAPALLGFSAPVLAVASITAGVVAAWTLHGRLDALTVSAGAFAALALVGLSGASLSLAGAAFVALAAAPRAMRVRGRPALLAHSVLALVGGGLGAPRASQHGADASTAVRAASLVVAGLLASMPTLVSAEEHTAHALQAIAEALTGDVSATLSRAADLRRRVTAGDVLAQLPSETWARIEAGWASLLHTATRRASLGPELAAGVGVVDERIAHHVDVLERVHAAAAERVARTLGLDDRGINGAKLEREGLEAEVRALTEIAAPPSA